MQPLREIDQTAAARVRKDLVGAHPFGEYRLISPSKIHYDDLYQRPVSLDAVQRIVREFDRRLFGAIILGERNSGKLFVIDGQHRLGASLNLNLAEIPCIVYPTKSAQEEARLFVALQERRRKLLPVHRFLAKLAYGDSTAQDIAELLRKYRFSIEQFQTFQNAPKQDTIKAIGLLERVYRMGGRERVSDILHIMRRAWNGEAEALSKMTIGGLARFFESQTYDLAKLTRTLKEIEPFSVVNRAYRMAHNNDISQAEAYAEVIADIYQKA